jgi:hypothetical protein
MGWNEHDEDVFRNRPIQDPGTSDASKTQSMLIWTYALLPVAAAVALIAIATQEVFFLGSRHVHVLFQGGFF